MTLTLTLGHATGTVTLREQSRYGNGHATGTNLDLFRYTFILTEQI
ncbi:hypothetical protein [Moorena sp. SIOASIH]|nr:hypothetical protein [Moorena sp. SIOASIH]